MRSIEQIIEGLPDNARKYIGAMAAKAKTQGTGLVYSFEEYYSRVRFAPTITGGGAADATYAFAANQTATAFSYGFGGDMTALAGFPTASGGTPPSTVASWKNATYADTNLLNATGRTTNGGGAMVIQGLSVHLEESSDPVLAQAIWPELYMTAGFDANLSLYRLGKPAFAPGAGALNAQGLSANVTPALNASFQQVPGSPNNGWPVGKNYRELEDQILWKPAPDPESLFGLQLVLGRAVTVTSLARAAAAGILAVAPPAFNGLYGSYVDVTFRLLGPVFKPRSTNQ